MKYTLIFLILLLNWPYNLVQAQQLPAPRVYFVTVDPETQQDCITWYRIPSPQVEHYDISYVVPRTGPFDSYMTAGSVPPTDTVWCNQNNNSVSLGHTVGYTVWGVDFRPQKGSFNSADSTIFLQAVFDSCKGTITLTWNDYNKWRGSTAGFILRQRLGPGNYANFSSVSGNTLTYVLNNVTPNYTYDLFVQAENVDGIRHSASNRVTVFTKMSQLTGSINANYATISAGNSIDLSFSVIGSTGSARYRLARSTDPAGPFETINSVNTPNPRITFTDDVPFTSGIYYYRLEMLNSCDQPFALSNQANNILLDGTLTGTQISLSWNAYLDWAGGVENYRIVRTRGNVNPVVDTLSNGTQLNYTENVTNLIDYSNPGSSLICYTIDALENTNSYGIKGRSISNKVCFVVTPDIRMPNAFIPNDAEQVNRIFEPVFSFTPEHYELIIYNRLGTKLWEGTGGWDGRVSGQAVPEGVYLYLLRVYNFSSEVRNINGKVVVVYR
jgi:hypothetical protein